MFRFLLRCSDRARHIRRRRFLGPDHAAGKLGEDLAHRYLQDEGFLVVARNWRARSGLSEIDLVARDGEKLVFVEVKTRASTDYGSPERAMDEEKRRRIFRGAREYVRRAGAEWSAVRFDYVGVVLSRPPRIEHLRDIYPLDTAR